MLRAVKKHRPTLLVLPSTTQGSVASIEDGASPKQGKHVMIAVADPRVSRRTCLDRTGFEPTSRGRRGIAPFCGSKRLSIPALVRKRGWIAGLGRVRQPSQAGERKGGVAWCHARAHTRITCTRACAGRPLSAPLSDLFDFIVAAFATHTATGALTPARPHHNPPAPWEW